MTTLIALVLLACGGPTPTTVKVEGETAQTIHVTSPLNLQGASVLDAEGKALEPQPANIVWTVTPAETAALVKVADGQTEGFETVESATAAKGFGILPKADGLATVTVSAGELKSTYTVNVALAAPVIEAPATPVTVGATAQLVVKAEATVDGAKKTIEGLMPKIESKNVDIATVDAAGLVTAVAAGTATIEGSLNGKTTSVQLTVAPADALAVAPEGAVVSPAPN